MKNGELVFELIRDQEVPVMEADWRRGIVESNPDSGWIRTDMVQVADEIQKHGDCKDIILQNEEAIDPFIGVHISSSDANAFLPANFEAVNSRGKPKWWIQKYLKGSFNYAAGLVYPNALACVRDDVPDRIPRHWPRIVSFDYGMHDDAVFLFAAIDPDEGKVVFYKEIVTNNKNIKELADMYFEGIADIPSGGMYCPPLIDPKSAPKRDYEKKTLSDHFLEYGIAFKPGTINRDARIFRLNTYIEMGYVVISDKCPYLLEQLKKLKFKEVRGDEQALTGKVEDKEDHGIVCAEWTVMELPANPKNLLFGIYNKEGKDITQTLKQREIEYSNWALSDPEDDIQNYNDYTRPEF